MPGQFVSESLEKTSGVWLSGELVLVHRSCAHNGVVWHYGLGVREEYLRGREGTTGESFVEPLVRGAALLFRISHYGLSPNGSIVEGEGGRRGA